VQNASVCDAVAVHLRRKNEVYFGCICGIKLASLQRKNVNFVSHIPENVVLSDVSTSVIIVSDVVTGVFVVADVVTVRVIRVHVILRTL